jgi:hypothetical protein
MWLISNCPAEIYNQTLVVTFNRDVSDDVCILFVVLNNGNEIFEKYWTIV